MSLFASKQSRRKKLLALPFPSAWLAYLHEDVFLYRLLSEIEQAKLRDALRIFVAEKHWEGCAGLQITEQMQVTIAAQACLLTLGFDDYCLDEVQTVLVYPGGFLALDPDSLGEQDRVAALLGCAHWQGPVVLSWWQASWDGRRLGQSNLVVHEFAHKFAELGDPSTGLPPLQDSRAVEGWNEVIEKEYHRLIDDAERDRPSLLDPYGASSRMEFFAVASESFFLHPAALHERHPQLYELLSECYHQDPAERRPEVEVAAEADEASEQYLRHAIAECDAAILLRPDYVDAYRQRAGCYRDLQDYENAIADSSVIIQRTTGEEQALARYERGTVYLDAGSYDEASADFTEVIRRLPDFAAAYRERGWASAAKGESAAAFADLTRALRLDPKDDIAYLQRARGYHVAGKLEKALRDFTRAIALAPHLTAAYRERAVVWIELGEYEQAIDDCNEAIRVDPGDAQAYRVRSEAHRAGGEEDKAEQDLARAKQLDAVLPGQVGRTPHPG
jgi:Mlc titration factor MtfA (ptsG expression regulator)/lipoprotein NlpI